MSLMWHQIIGVCTDLVECVVLLTSLAYLVCVDGSSCAQLPSGGLETIHVCVCVRACVAGATWYNV